MRIDDVSRETNEKLIAFSKLAEQWNRSINLYSRSDDIWDRHILDSIQLADLIPTSSKIWLDIGSGGGFPAVPCAILRGTGSPKLIMIESDQRKCSFLKKAVLSFDLNAEVVNQRIEAASPSQADVITARALASLDRLFELTEKHATPKTIYLFQKGKTFQDEIETARTRWTFDCDVIVSKTSPQSAILRIKDVARV